MSDPLVGPFTGFTKQIFTNICRIETDRVAPYFGQTGIYVLNGVNTGNSLATTSATPVVVGDSGIPSAGETLVAFGLDGASWQAVSQAPIDAEFILWPPANTASDALLTNAYVMADGDQTNVAVDGTNVRVNLNDISAPAGSYTLPTIVVDAKGRITNAVGSSARQDVNFTAGQNVQSISFQESEWALYYNCVIVQVSIEFVSQAVVAPATPIIFGFTGLPVPPASRTIKPMAILNTDDEVIQTGVVYVDPNSPTTLFFSTGNTSLTTSDTRKLVGSIVYPAL